MLEDEAEAKAEAEDKSSRPSPRTKFWPRGRLVLEDLTSLVVTGVEVYGNIHYIYAINVWVYRHYGNENK